MGKTGQIDKNFVKILTGLLDYKLVRAEYIYDLEKEFPLTTLYDIKIQDFKSERPWHFPPGDITISNGELSFMRLYSTSFHFLEYCRYIATIAFYAMINKHLGNPLGEIRTLLAPHIIHKNDGDDEMIDRLLKTKLFGPIPQVSLQEDNGIYTLFPWNYEIKNPDICVD